VREDLFTVTRRHGPQAITCISMASLFLLLGPRASVAQKTDSVWIRNGDRITGEVNSLSRGLLKYSTDDLGTVSIEWDKVDRITTTTVLEVRLSSGQKLYGPLFSAPAGTAVLAADTIPLREILAMVPIKGQLLSRLDGYLDLGFSYQKAHKDFQLSTGARVEYRGPTTQTTLEANTFIEDRDDAEETARFSAALTERLFLGLRWSGGMVVGFDRNEELDLAGRARVVGFGARTLAQSNHIELTATGGVLVTREGYLSTDSTISGLEGLLGVAFRAFRYDRPKLNASLTSQAFPSFTVPGRVRLQNDVRLSYELVKDFMLTLTLFDTYDSKPQAPGAPKNDFGTTLAITWTY
jgi:hypothetical protein